MRDIPKWRQMNLPSYFEKAISLANPVIGQFAKKAKKCLIPGEEWSLAIDWVLYLAGVYCKIKRKP